MYIQCVYTPLFNLGHILIGVAHIQMYREKNNYQENCQRDYETSVKRSLEKSATYSENSQKNYERNYESLVKSLLEKLAVGLGEYSIMAKEMNQRMKVSDFPRLEI